MSYIHSSNLTYHNKVCLAFKHSSPYSWQYIAEGARNVVCKYTGNDLLLNRFVIRVRKENKSKDLLDREISEDFTNNCLRPVSCLLASRR